MWYWEVVWEDLYGEQYSTGCKSGYPTRHAAERAYELGEEDIHEQLAELGGRKIVEVCVVFRDDYIFDN